MISLLSMNVLHNRQAKRIFDIHDYALFVPLIKRGGSGENVTELHCRLRGPTNTKRCSEQ